MPPTTDPRLERIRAARERVSSGAPDQRLSRIQAARARLAPAPEAPSDLSAGENFRQDALRVGRQLDEGMSRANEAETFGEGLLQAGGSLAKAFGGALAAGGEAIGRAVLPKSGEKLVEAGAAKLGAAIAPVVAPIGEAYSGFASENPRLARNIEAVGNIALNVPLLGTGKAASKVADVTADAARAGRAAARNIATPSPLGVAEVATGRTVEQVASRLDDILNVEGVSSVRKASERAAGKGTNVSKILAENRAIPLVADGKFQTADAIYTLASKASSLSETLEAGIKGLGKKTSVSDLKAAVREASIKDPDLSSRGAALEAARKAEAQLDDYARQVALRDKLGVKMADALDVYDQQLFKKGQYKESRAFRNDQSKVDSAALLARVFRQNIEKAAGSDAVRLVNSEIGRLEEAMNVLSALDGKAVKGGRLGGIAGRAIGATLGVSGGGPLGGIVGAILGGAASAALQQTAVAGPIRRVLLARSAKAPSVELAKALRYLEDLGPLADEGVARTVAEAASEANVVNLLRLPAKAGPSKNPLDVVSVTPGGKASRSAQEAADVAAVETGRAKVPRVTPSSGPLFHGSAYQFDAFDSGLSKGGNAGKGIYLTDSENAARYYSALSDSLKKQADERAAWKAGDRRAFDTTGKVSNVYEVRLKKSAKIKEHSGGIPSPEQVESYREQGFDAVVYPDDTFSVNESWDSEAYGEMPKNPKATLVLNSDAIEKVSPEAPKDAFTPVRKKKR